MNSVHSITIALVLAVVWVLAPAAPAFGQSEPKDFRARVQQRLMAEANTVFLGVVVEVDAAASANVPERTPTVVMRVETVFERAKGQSLAKGDLVTVAPLSLNLTKKGVRATVYAVSWILGDRLAVREIGTEVHVVSPDEAKVGRIAAEIQDAKRGLQRALLRQRLKAADVVVVGKVSAIRPLTLTAERAQRPILITEHDPGWREAVITVESNLKGAKGQRTIVVRFPASRDKRWYKVPKFHKGQEGTFLLSGAAQPGLHKMAIMNAKQTPAFTAMDSRDVLGRSEASLIRELLR